ncbi:MAG: amidohydrolase family protein [Acidothermaceae bacterium]
MTEPNRLIVDAHQHLWEMAEHPQTWMNPDTDAAINRDFVVDDLRAAAATVELAATVVVQSVNDRDETTHLLARAEAASDLIAGVVGWADLTASDLDDLLSHWRAEPGGHRLAGLRHLVQNEPDAGWLDRPDVRRGLRCLARHDIAFDLLVDDVHLPAAVRVASDLPETHFVLDHLGKPPLRSGDLAQWTARMRELGGLPNVWAKVSGLVTEAAPGNRSAAQLQPVVDVALDEFGPSRLMFGSDWPVCLLAASYGEVVSTAQQLLMSLSEPEQRQVFADNAIAFYRLRL